jgi:hypothetical protein
MSEKATSHVIGQDLSPLEKVNGQMPHLLVGDIVLIRHKKSWARHFLRRATNSYWDHATLVIFPRNPAHGQEFSVIVENIRHGWKSIVFHHGATLHRLDRYLFDPESYDIGIKRFKDLSDEERRHVQLYMLMNVDAPYWPWSLTKMLLSAYFSRWRAYFRQQTRFSCSSLIQEAYYDSVGWDRKNHVIFRKDAWAPIELQEMTSPADIAQSAAADWVYNKHD